MEPFKAKGYRAKEVHLVHKDLCGPMSCVRGGYEYFITFINDYSGYGYIYLMCHKSKAFEKFKEYKMEVEKQRGKNIKSLHLIMEVNTSWVSLDSSSRIMGLHPRCRHLASLNKME